MTDFRKFKFVSPGVRVEEIDNTLREATPKDMGALFIGRAKKGPIFKPIYVTSAKELVDIFGPPESGVGGNGDVWRNGDCLSPMYGLYAAFAYLQNHSSATFLRIAGDEHPVRTSGYGEAGWITTKTAYNDNGTEKIDGGAYALFIYNINPLVDGTTTVKSLDWTGNVTISGKYNNNRFVNGKFDNFSIVVKIENNTNSKFGYKITHGTYIYEVSNLDMNRGTNVSINDDGVPTGLTIQFGLPEAYTDNSTITFYPKLIGNAIHAATFYVDEGAMALKGKSLVGNTDVVGNAVFVKNSGPDFEFVARVYKDASSIFDYEKEIVFNFNNRSSKYIRNVFNTNPTLTNEDITPVNNVVNYWLGESFRSSVYKQLDKTPEYYGTAACLLKIEQPTDIGTGTYVSGANHLAPFKAAESGWIFSQCLDADGPGVYGSGVPGKYDPNKMVKLFRFKSIDGGAWFHANVKVSIDRIRYSKTRNKPFGSFDVVVRSNGDTDKNPVILEMFANCDLDVTSPNFIAKRIGDVHYEWRDNEKRYVKYGSYDNNSKYIYVEVSNEVMEGSIEPSLLPWGYYGAVTYGDVKLTGAYGANDASIAPQDPDALTWVTGGNQTSSRIAFPVATTGEFSYSGVGLDINLRSASIRLREGFSEEGGDRYQNVFWGDRTVQWDVDKYDSDCQDYLRCDNLILRGKDGSEKGMRYASIFTLDDVCYEEVVNVTPNYSLKTRSTYIQDSYKYGRSITAGYFRKQDGSLDTTIRPDYRLLCDLDAARFTVTFYGGFDGLDICEKDPFRNTILNNYSVPDDATESYALYSVLKAIDIVSDKDMVEYDMVMIPGVTNEIVLRQLSNMAKTRKDCLAILDLPGQYLPPAEDELGEAARKGSLSNTISKKNEMELAEDNSYAACYFNWLKIIDPFNRTLRVWVPPSVGVAGVLAYSRHLGDVWDAPAGYNRANLSMGHGGLSVVDVMFALNNEERDMLYENGINPIARFPEGILIMGQKTMQRFESYLDRINIRLLVNHIKRYVEFKGKKSLFEDNIYVTWQKFINEIEPFLRDIQTRGGLNSYEIVFDDTTTTPDMVDRNEMYAKIYIQPTTVAEFFGVDLVIAKNGVNFLE